MKKVWFVGAAVAALAGCGGGGGSSATPQSVPTATPTPSAAPSVAPSPSPTPGAVALSSTAETFPAVGSTLTLTATESNYTGTFKATSSCPSVTVPATATSGSFTLTAVSAATSGCTISVTGATGVAAATASATVPTPGGVQLRWYTPQSVATSTNPLPISSAPISLIGLGATYDAILAVSETNITSVAPSTFAISALAPSAGCTGNVTATPLTTVPSSLPTQAPYTILTYYDVDATAVVASGCTLSYQDNYVPASGPTPAPVSINVIVTAGSGGQFQ